MKRSIVVVDDAAESRDIAAALLAAEGYDVSTASGEEEALEAILQRPPSAVLFQIREPAKRAIDFVRRLALSRQAMFVPMVLVTRLSEFQVESFLNGVPGVRKILSFPCSPEDLRKATATAVRYARAN